MHFQTAARLFQYLPKHPKDALTATELTKRLSKCFPAEKFVLRTVQRHLNELSTSELGPFVVALDEKGQPNRYYLDLSKVANWMMTEENALNLMLAKDLLSGYFRDVEQMRQENLQQVAEGVLEQNPGSMLQNIQANVRVVSDGIGRQNAVIDPAILRVVFEAIGSKEALKLHYVSSRREESDKVLNPLGLVAKDGTIYLLATRGLENRPKHYALHRARAAERVARPRSVPPGFDLDQYIERSHKLSHVLDEHEGEVELQLRVAPETMYHFRERPLSKNQQIDEHNRDERGWFLVTNTIPVTIQLVPFLLSHGGWIEVVGPESVRQEMKRRLDTAAAHYGK